MKKNFFQNIDFAVLANKFKTLSEPSRLKILKALLNGEKSVNQIVEETGLVQSNVSKQLKKLLNDGIIECRPDKVQRFYRVIDDTVFELCKILCQQNQSKKKSDAN